MKGSVIDEKYSLDEEIGQGGFGVVYRGSDVRTGNTCAIKVFRPITGNDSIESLERFKLEAASAQRVQHENAIRVFDSGVSSTGVAFIVMELLHGDTLTKLLKEKKKLAPAELTPIIIAVCDALAVAHSLGIVHRDIKPDNVFLHDVDGRKVPKVLDFGVAKQQGGAATQTLTMTGAFVGTPTYMAPERLEDQPYDGRSDVYSVGIMMYQMLVGKTPFAAAGDNLFSVVMAHLQQAPTPLIELDASIPADLQELVMATLAKAPDERPTASELAAKLRALTF